MQLVVSIVSERTGYPVETLGIDLDLEADLSIDSIKRIEIIGELAQRLGLRVEGKGGTDAIVEELATRKTLRSLVAWLSSGSTRRSRRRAAASELEAVTPIRAPSGRRAGRRSARGELRRYKLARRRDAGAAQRPHVVHGQAHRDLRRRRDRRSRSRSALIGEGATVTRVERRRRSPAGRTSTASSISASSTACRRCARCSSACAARCSAARRVIYVATMNGELGRGGFGGPAGLIKTLAAEFPDVRARVVDLESTECAGECRGQAARRAVTRSDRHLEIGYIGRRALELRGRARRRLIAGGSRARRRARSCSSPAARAASPRRRRSRSRTATAAGSSWSAGSALPGRRGPALAAAATPRRCAARSRKRAARHPASHRSARRSACSPTARSARRSPRSATARAYHAVDVRSPELGELIDDVYERHGRHRRA